MFLIWIREELLTIETQSSPVLTMLFLTATPWDALIWIPSVLGLVAGAITLRLDTVTLRQLAKAMRIC